MRTAILTNASRFTSGKRSKISLASQKKEFSMVNKRSMLDVVTAKQRLSVPFKYRLLCLKNAILGLILNVGVAI